MNPYMAYPQLAHSDAQSAPKLPGLSAHPKLHDEFGKELTEFFSEFGEVRKISKFMSNGAAGFVLVCFACTSAAMNAANSTGCSMFGFCAVRVNLNEMNLLI